MSLCKGSWKDSARNINYKDNEVLCELAGIDGKWVKNRLAFIPHIEYYNKDGRFAWHNCQNEVELGNNSYEHVSRRYKKISIEQCLEKKNNEFDDWFVIEKEYIQSKNKQICISISLFKKNVDNTYENEHPVDEEKWNQKYYLFLISNLDKFKPTNMCVNLYLANDLQICIPELLKYEFLNIYVMKSESIGAMPGMLWRFMNMTNKMYRTVYIADIDETWDWIEDWEGRGLNEKLSTHIAGDGLISENPYQPSYNFATVIGSHVRAIPDKYNYNIIDVIKGFLVLCKERENSKNPNCFDDEDPITLWNHPLSGLLKGWGRDITKYGFDEFFLKHVIYHDAYPDVSLV